MADKFSFQMYWYTVDLDMDRQLFLSYTYGREHGPGIDRDGLTSPRMVEISKPWLPNETDAARQRFYTWKVGDPAVPDKNGASLDHLNAELPPTTHCDYFRSLCGDEWGIEAAQGCGNLTMNLWFVAYYRPSGAYGNRDKRREGLIYLPDEARLMSAPTAEQESDRKYSCLVKWRPQQMPKGQLSISDLRFNPFHCEQAVWFDRGQVPPENVTDQIEFAVFGQQVIREGRSVDLSTITQQFSDVRHLFRLPNIQDVLGREEAREALWFGENQLVGDRPEVWDRRRGALSRPVELDWSYITERGFRRRDPKEWREEVVAKAFEQKGYKRIQGDVRPPEKPGEFRFDPANTDLVDVWLLPNPYPLTFVGLGKPEDQEYGRTNHLILMAVSGLSP
jgi:hypothetical protein